MQCGGCIRRGQRCSGQNALEKKQRLPRPEQTASARRFDLAIEQPGRSIDGEDGGGGAGVDAGAGAGGGGGGEGEGEQDAGGWRVEGICRRNGGEWGIDEQQGLSFWEWLCLDGPWPLMPAPSEVTTPFAARCCCGGRAGELQYGTTRPAACPLRCSRRYGWRRERPVTLIRQLRVRGEAPTTRAALLSPLAHPDSIGLLRRAKLNRSRAVYSPPAPPAAVILSQLLALPPWLLDVPETCRVASHHVSASKHSAPRQHQLR